MRSRSRVLGSPAVLEWLEHLITEYLGRYGYEAVFVLMVLESACIPIPSEVTMLFGGAAANATFAATLPGEPAHLNFIAIGLVGAVANVVGSWIAYWIGLRGGRPLIERWGRYVFLRPHELDRAEAWFADHGEAAVFVSRLLPVIRTFISVPAGVAKMPFGKFTIYTFLGVIPWTYGLTYIGVLVGDNWRTVLEYFDLPTLVIGAIVVGAAAYWYIRRRRRLASEGARQP